MCVSEIVMQVLRPTYITALLLVGTLMLQGQDPDWASRWDTLTPLPDDRYAHASCVIDDKIYLVGGYISGFTAAKNIIQIYDTESDSWEIVDMSHQFKRGFPSALSIEGKIYVLGGAKGQPPVDSDNHTYFSLDVWDAESYTWQVRANVPGDNLGPSCVLNNSIYVVGGFNYDPGPVEKTYRYDIEKDKWERVADLNKARVLPGIVAHKGKIYAFGGITKEMYSAGLGDITCEIYDPGSDTWTPGPELPDRWYFLGKEGILSINDDILIFGACRGPWARHNAEDRVYLLNGNTNQWEIYDSVPGYGSFYCVERVANKLYLLGRISPNNFSYEISHLLSEQEETAGILIYPNPVISQCRIIFSTLKPGYVHVNIRNSLGLLVKQLGLGTLPVGEYEIPVDLSGLEAGIYFVSLFADNVSCQLLIKE